MVGFESESGAPKENIVNDQNHNDLIVEIAFEIVQEAAPNEKPLFEAYRKAFLRNQGALFKEGSQNDEMLGFGTDDSITMLAPFILNIITEIVKLIAENARKSIKTEKTSDETKAAIKGAFKKYQNDKVKPNPLTPEQALAIRKMIIAKGGQMKIPEDRIKILADTVVGGLVIKLS